MRFELRDGRPFVTQTCEACGTVRRYRAWERYWDPAAAGVVAEGGAPTRR